MLPCASPAALAAVLWVDAQGMACLERHLLVAGRQLLTAWGALIMACWFRTPTESLSKLVLWVYVCN
jgi:hypothetical protein